MTVCFFLYPLLPAFAPTILNSILNLENDTFKKSLCVPIEYFIDVDEHFVLPFLHIYYVVVSTGIFISGTGSAYIVLVYHLIGRFNAMGWVKVKELIVYYMFTTVSER